MTDMIQNRIRSICGIILSASLVLSGICLIAACLGIYFSGGEDPYSPATVAAAYRPIAWVLWLSIGLTAVCLVLRLFLPEKEKLCAQADLEKVLERLRAKLAPDTEALRQADALAAQRCAEQRISIVLTVVGSLVFLVYALNGSHFHDQDINGSVIRAMWWLLPCMGLPYGWALFAACHSRSLLKQERELLRAAPKAAAPLPAEDVPSRVSFGWLRWAILAVGIGILIFGFLTGGTLDVLTKAINICTECVGLG